MIKECVTVQYAQPDVQLVIMIFVTHVGKDFSWIMDIVSPAAQHKSTKSMITSPLTMYVTGKMRYVWISSIQHKIHAEGADLLVILLAYPLTSRVEPIARQAKHSAHIITIYLKIQGTVMSAVEPTVKYVLMQQYVLNVQVAT